MDNTQARNVVNALEAANVEYSVRDSGALRGELLNKYGIKASGLVISIEAGELNRHPELQKQLESAARSKAVMDRAGKRLSGKEIPRLALPSTPARSSAAYRDKVAVDAKPTGTGKELTGPEKEAALDRLVKAMPEGAGRERLANALGNPELRSRIHLYDTDDLGSRFKGTPGTDQAGLRDRIRGFTDFENGEIHLGTGGEDATGSISEANASKTAQVLNEELTHVAIAERFERAALTKALAAQAEQMKLDKNRSGGKSPVLEEMRRDLQMGDYRGSDIPEEMLHRIIDLKEKGKWTSDLEKKYKPLSAMADQVIGKAPAKGGWFSKLGKAGNTSFGAGLAGLNLVHDVGVLADGKSTVADQGLHAISAEVNSAVLAREVLGALGMKNKFTEAMGKNAAAMGPLMVVLGAKDALDPHKTGGQRVRGAVNAGLGLDTTLALYAEFAGKKALSKVAGKLAGPVGTALLVTDGYCWATGQDDLFTSGEKTVAAWKELEKSQEVFAHSGLKVAEEYALLPNTANYEKLPLVIREAVKRGLIEERADGRYDPAKLKEALQTFREQVAKEVAEGKYDDNYKGSERIHASTGDKVGQTVAGIALGPTKLAWDYATDAFTQHVVNSNRRSTISGLTMIDAALKDHALYADSYERWRQLEASDPERAGTLKQSLEAITALQKAHVIGRAGVTYQLDKEEKMLEKIVGKELVETIKKQKTSQRSKLQRLRDMSPDTRAEALKEQEAQLQAMGLPEQAVREHVQKLGSDEELDKLIAETRIVGKADIEQVAGMNATAQTLAEFVKFEKMTDEERHEYLEGNAKFLKGAGIARYSPLANTLLTYDNLIEKAAALGVTAQDLRDIGFGKQIETRQRKLAADMKALLVRQRAEGKLHVDNLSHYILKPDSKASDADRLEYIFLRSKFGLPPPTDTGPASHLDSSLAAMAGVAEAERAMIVDYHRIGYHINTDSMRQAEREYLRANPAAQQCLAAGLVKSGLEHFARIGIHQGLKYGGLRKKSIAVEATESYTRNYDLELRAAYITNSVVDIFDARDDIPRLEAQLRHMQASLPRDYQQQIEEMAQRGNQLMGKEVIPSKGYLESKSICEALEKRCLAEPANVILRQTYMKAKINMQQHFLDQFRVMREKAADYREELRGYERVLLDDVQRMPDTKEKALPDGDAYRAAAKAQQDCEAAFRAAKEKWEGQQTPETERAMTEALLKLVSAEKSRVEQRERDLLAQLVLPASESLAASQYKRFSDLAAEMKKLTPPPAETPYHANAEERIAKARQDLEGAQRAYAAEPTLHNELVQLRARQRLVSQQQVHLQHMEGMVYSMTAALRAELREGEEIASRMAAIPGPAISGPSFQKWGQEQCELQARYEQTRDAADRRNALVAEARLTFAKVAALREWKQQHNTQIKAALAAELQQKLQQPPSGLPLSEMEKLKQRAAELGIDKEVEEQIKARADDNCRRVMDLREGLANLVQSYRQLGKPLSDKHKKAFEQKILDGEKVVYEAAIKKAEIAGKQPLNKHQGSANARPDAQRTQREQRQQEAAAIVDSLAQRAELAAVISQDPAYLKLVMLEALNAAYANGIPEGSANRAAMAAALADAMSEQKEKLLNLPAEQRAKLIQTLVETATKPSGGNGKDEKAVSSPVPGLTLPPFPEGVALVAAATPGSSASPLGSMAAVLEAAAAAITTLKGPSAAQNNPLTPAPPVPPSPSKGR